MIDLIHVVRGTGPTARIIPPFHVVDRFLASLVMEEYFLGML